MAGLYKKESYVDNKTFQELDKSSNNIKIRSVKQNSNNVKMNNIVIHKENKIVNQPSKNITNVNKSDKSITKKQINNIFDINLLNVQGLSQPKMIEIEQLLCVNDTSIFCLTETHQTRNTIKMNDDIQILSKMRNIKEKKGGGLMLLWNKNNGIKIEKIDTNHSDILLAFVEIGKCSFYLLLVYMATNDDLINIQIYKEVYKCIESFSNEKFLILGDFNGHIGTLGHQKMNKNGKKIINLVDKYNLHILNLDLRCDGIITWQQNNLQSVIDYGIVNECMYENFVSMMIDESWEIIKISDHNFINFKFSYCIEKSLGKNKTELISFNRKTEAAINNYIKFIDENLSNVDNINITNLNKLLLDAENKFLKVTIKKRVNILDKVEPIWITKEIKKDIALKRQINKERRKETDEIILRNLKSDVLKQKDKIQKLVSNAVEQFEINMTQRIKKDINRSKKIWLHIDTLRNRETKRNNPIKIYDNNGEQIDENDIRDKITEFWNPLYTQHENKISSEWNDEAKMEYITEIKNNNTVAGKYISSINIESGNIQYVYENINIPESISEHYCMAMPVEKFIKNMKKPIITLEDVENQIKKLRNGKASGPDQVKPELYKYLIENRQVMNHIMEILINIIDEEKIPKEWKESKTTLIQKKKKPKVNDLRPIALTNISYKILMGILKNKIEAHLKETNNQNDLQTGATSGRRVTENIYILNHCIQRTFKMKKSLFILSIDFTKAFDSIERIRLIETLKYFKIHPKIINIIADIYSNDSTKLFLNNKEISEVDISSGIRQGCNISALLFVMVTYKIIEQIHNIGYGFRDEEFHISSLFYMDDGLIFAENQEQLSNMIFRLENICIKFGLKLNHSKCKIMKINNNTVIDKIYNIEVVDNIKYLGITIDNKRKCFKSHKVNLFNKALKYTSQIYSILGNACNRMLIGKTFYKGLVLPNILYASDVITFTESEINDLQKMDNKAYRYILQVPSYTASEFLRGEIGASSAKARDIKNKLLFLKHSLRNDGNNLLKEIVLFDIQKKESDYAKLVIKYLSDLGLTINQIKELKVSQIKNKIYDYDKILWIQGMQSKSTLTMYRNNKQEIREEKWMKNGQKYSTMMKIRSNSLKLSWREFNNAADKICSLCSIEIETVEHFMLDCNKLNELRNEYIHLQLPRNENRANLINTVLLFHKDELFSQEYFINMMQRLWNHRNLLLKERASIISAPN